MERFLYAFSPLHCLAVSMQDGGAGTGTVMRPDTVRRYAADAGFDEVEVLDVEHPQFRLYKLALMSDLAVVGDNVDGVVTVTLNRPEKKNALSIALRDELSDAFDALASDDAVRVVVITGAGSVFSAGFDLGEFADPDPEHQRRLWDSSDRFHHTVLRFPLPVVAAVNGPALAGGFDLAVLCDLRVAADTAYFAHVEHTFGDVVYRPLRDLVGGSVAAYPC